MKKIFITGAGSGLGKEAAIELSKRGHYVIATTQYEEQVNILKNYAKKENLKLEVFKLDILNTGDREKISNLDIDVFIVNAAIGDSGSVADIKMDRIKSVFETNVFANIETVQLALKNMIEINKKGRIIFISSLVGRISMPFLSPYCASKSAIEAFAISLKSELKQLNAKIDVTIIEPGAYATGFNKINIDKKYEWMYENSYFKSIVNVIKKREEKLWEMIEIKKFRSIIKKYIKAVEKKHVKTRYTAIWWQSVLVQIARVLGN